MDQLALSSVAPMYMLLLFTQYLSSLYNVSVNDETFAPLYNVNVDPDRDNANGIDWSYVKDDVCRKVVMLFLFSKTTLLLSVTWLSLYG